MLEKMPVSIGTKARMGYRDEMERKMANIEDAIAKFSTDKEIFIDISGSQE